MQAAVAKAFAAADLNKIWLEQGAAPGGAPTARFATFVTEEIGKWGKVVRDGNITIE
jgi:tripartite-type tricarboxylate transporter receptor subunit TctC